MRKVFFFIPAFLCLFNSPASAQEIYVPIVQIIPDIATQNALSSNVRMMNNHVLAQGSLSPQRYNEQRTQLPVNSKALTYSPSLSRRNANIANMINAIKTQDAAGGARVEEDFKSQDIFAGLGQQIRPLGLQIENVSHAFATYWVHSWLLAHADFSDQSKEQMQAVIGQVSQILLSNKEFGLLNNAQKQEMAEAFWLQAILAAAALDTVKYDASLQKAYADSIRQSVKKSGLDLDAMTLTDKGFVPVKRR
jgi:hypothetical protein